MEDLRAWIEVDLSAIIANLKLIQQMNPEIGIMAVIKANAYGLGAIPVAKTVISHGASWLGVALVEEGIALREAGIAAPILVLGVVPNTQVPLAVRWNLSVAFTDYSGAEVLAEAGRSLGKTASGQLKVDTGMHRLGVKPDKVKEVLEKSRRLKGLKVDGIFTHLATADLSDDSEARKQVETMKMLRQELGKDCPRLVHWSNSSGLLKLAKGSSFIRAGIALYGLKPSQDLYWENLIPALSLKARISRIEELEAGEPIGYAASYYTQSPCQIITIPVGYGDGYTRRLSHKGTEVLIRGNRYPIVGNICMDQFMVEVPLDEPVSLDDEVVLIGRQGKEEITADELADKSDTIHYEIITELSQRLTRVYKNGATI
ncbi:MAG: alanine racemase [Firmicutes bacterium]|nr:alanine racemase [Bacillota bacterium]MDD4692976.1 alanine racemase [Bacillota bacterium]